MSPLPPGEPWATGAVSTASWSGPSLAHLLDRAGVRDDAVEILVTGADRGTPSGAAEATRFARALPLDKARDPNVIVAIEMNGSPLPPEHGAPARLIVPGWYGMASVKWVARIAALTEPFEGWFQHDRYTYVAHGRRRPVDVMRVKSMIVAPESGTGVARGRVEVWGWAWSGAASIAAVDVRLDDGWLAGGDARRAAGAARLAPLLARGRRGPGGAPRAAGARARRRRTRAAGDAGVERARLRQQRHRAAAVLRLLNVAQLATARGG